jgi:hypothetical protein
MVHVASANFDFLLDIFFNNFVNALDFRDSILNDFCFFKIDASNWNGKKKYIYIHTHTHTHTPICVSQNMNAHSHIKRHYTPVVFLKE